MGEILERIIIKNVKKPYKRGPLQNAQKVMIFGNGGGRGHTFHYFLMKGICAEPYYKSIEKRLCREATEELIFDEASNSWVDTKML